MRVGEEVGSPPNEGKRSMWLSQIRSSPVNNDAASHYLNLLIHNAASPLVGGVDLSHPRANDKISLFPHSGV